jgi:pimeloyl-ACP methyl ester carboxylesterase
MNERYVELDRGDGTRITARIRPGQSAPLVLVPGTWGNMRTRGAFVAALDPALTIVNVALPGQDDNWPPPANPSIEQFARDVLRLADHLAFDRFFIGGHSLGGMISIEMIRIAAERLLGVISLEGWTHWTALYDAFGDATNSTLTPEQEALIAAERKLLLDRWDPALRARYGTIWREWDGSETLDNATLPILSVWGDRGKPRPPRATLKIPTHGNIELVWIPGVSHNLLVEAPETVAEAVNGFVRKASV